MKAFSEFVNKRKLPLTVSKVKENLIEKIENKNKYFSKNSLNNVL